MSEENRGGQASQAEVDAKAGAKVEATAEVKAKITWKMPVYARVRPRRGGREALPIRLRSLEDSGKDDSLVQVTVAASDELTSLQYLNNKRQNYKFVYDGAYGPTTDQETLFSEVAQPVIDSCLEGYNGTIFAYGQTGSGKTYTMTGGETYPERGLIPRTISTLFSALRASPGESKCFVSYIEVYNENVYDLLDSKHRNKPMERWKKLTMLEDDDGELHLRGLTAYDIESDEEALNLLFLGNVNRVTSETPMNKASSRSHCECGGVG